jgi:hypothetical protein
MIMVTAIAAIVLVTAFRLRVLMARCLMVMLDRFGIVIRFVVVFVTAAGFAHKDGSRGDY